jgi:hypothetical protein
LVKEGLHAIAGESVPFTVTRNDTSCPTLGNSRELFHLKPISIWEDEISENGRGSNVTTDGDATSTDNRVLRGILSLPALSKEDKTGPIRDS